MEFMTLTAIAWEGTILASLFVGYKLGRLHEAHLLKRQVEQERALKKLPTPEEMAVARAEKQQIAVRMRRE